MVVGRLPIVFPSEQQLSSPASPLVATTREGHTRLDATALGTPRVVLERWGYWLVDSVALAVMVLQR
jgi:hypothetical protein